MSYSSRNFDFVTVTVLEEEYNLWSSLLYSCLWLCVASCNWSRYSPQIPLHNTSLNVLNLILFSWKAKFHTV